MQLRDIDHAAMHLRIIYSAASLSEKFTVPGDLQSMEKVNLMMQPPATGHLLSNTLVWWAGINLVKTLVLIIYFFLLNISKHNLFTLIDFEHGLF